MNKQPSKSLPANNYQKTRESVSKVLNDSQEHVTRLQKSVEEFNEFNKVARVFLEQSKKAQ